MPNAGPQVSSEVLDMTRVVFKNCLYSMV